MAWIRLLKLLRVYRFYAASQETDGSHSAGNTTIVVGALKLLPVVLGVSHLLACIWWYIGTAPIVANPAASETGKHWVKFYPAFKSDAVYEDVAIYRQYFLSLYWVIASLSTNG